MATNYENLTTSEICEDYVRTLADVFRVSPDLKNFVPRFAKEILNFWLEERELYTKYPGENYEYNTWSKFIDGVRAGKYEVNVAPIGVYTIGQLATGLNKIDDSITADDYLAAFAKEVKRFHWGSED